MKLSIILGSGFGDEGKGNVTNWLTRDHDNSLVVRFNGGHQAGHTVVENGISHVFSSFGSGTLNGTLTFWSKYCTLFPTGFNNEYDALINNLIVPMICVDPLCPIVTPFDIDRGRFEEESKGHGSCGTGFGKTVWRHETLDHSYRIFAKDLECEWILRKKLKALQETFPWTGRYTIDIEHFIQNCLLCSQRIWLTTERDIFSNKYETFVFEGAQGILLDREHGIFPHVTRSHTTSKNAMEIIDRNFIGPEIDIFYVSRCYQTRHGNGPLMGECSVEELGIENFENETNVDNQWQGKFRYARLNFELLRYSIETDKIYNDRFDVNRKRVITCMDQFADNVPIQKNNGETAVYDKSEFIDLFPKGTIFSLSPDMSSISMK